MMVKILFIEYKKKKNMFIFAALKNEHNKE